MESVLVLTLEPILNPIWVLLVVGETPGAMALLGGAVVIGAVLGRALCGLRVVGRGPGRDRAAASGAGASDGARPAPARGVQ